MTYYISITGMRLKSIWHFPRFVSYSKPSMTQAKAAAGNISADGNYVDGVLHTLSVWEDRKSMTRFMASGAHAKAMKVISDIALDGAVVYGYESDEIPTWEEAVAIWKENGIYHGSSRTKQVSKSQPLSRYNFSILVPTTLLAVWLLKTAYDNALPLNVIYGAVSIIFFVPINFGILNRSLHIKQ